MGHDDIYKDPPLLQLCPWLNGDIAMKVKSCAVVGLRNMSMNLGLGEIVSKVQGLGDRMVEELYAV